MLEILGSRDTALVQKTYNVVQLASRDAFTSQIVFSEEY